MTTYKVTFSCGECSSFHATKVWLSLTQYFARKTRISEAYRGKSLPPEVVKLLRTPALCPMTRNSVFLDYTDQLYLIPE